MSGALPEPSTNYFLKVWYLGTHFSGSQRQAAERTVEGELIRVLQKLGYITDATTNNFRAAVRTDAGVHARNAVFGFMSPEKCYPMALNTHLPKDMGVWGWAVVPPDTHPRFDALTKEYHYLYIKPTRTPVNSEIMRQGLHVLLEPHDFRLFMKRDISKTDQQTTMTLLKAEMEEFPSFFIFKFRSRFFLWQQVRRMVQFLVDLGTGIRSLDQLHEYFSPLALQDPTHHKIRPAPAEGLILWDIAYPESISFHFDERSVNYMQQTLQAMVEKYAIRAATYRYFSDSFQF